MNITVKDAEWQSQTIDPMGPPQANGEIVVFYKKIKKNEVQSRAQGRPVFTEAIHMKIIQGGDNLMTWDQPVRESDREKYAAQWERWVKTNENRIPGTPIEAWPVLSDIQKAEFKALNIWTIEQFANLPDSAGGKIMGFNDLRQRAQVFIEAGKDAELMARVRQEADEKLKGQQAQIDALMAKLAEVQAAQQAPAKRRPGRKPAKKATEEVPVGG